MGLIAIGLLLVANAFFVAVEFALVAASRYQVEALAKAGSWRARITLRALHTLTFDLSGTQLGITVSSLLLGFLIEPVLAPMFEDIILLAPFLPQDASFAFATIVALAVLTASQMIASELIPKNLAIARPVPTALALAPIAYVLNRIFKPLVWFLNSLADKVLRLIGMQTLQEHGGTPGLTELRQIIHRSARTGLLPDVRLDLIERSLRFGRKTALEVLVPRGVVLDIRESATLADLAVLVNESGFSRFPVYETDGDEIVGLIHVQEVFKEPPENWDHILVRDRIQPPLVVPSTKLLTSLFMEMRDRQTSMAIIADEHGMMAGVVSLEDILEEIFGDIEDEYDTPSLTAHQPHTATDGSVLVSGLMTAQELDRICGFAFPKGPYETLAGFLLLHFQRIPAIGDATTFGTWRFQVLAMEGRRITRIRIMQLNQEPSA